MKETSWNDCFTEALSWQPTNKTGTILLHGDRHSAAICKRLSSGEWRRHIETSVCIKSDSSRYISSRGTARMQVCALICIDHKLIRLEWIRFEYKTPSRVAIPSQLE